jgi:[histone H3]-lysine9 N-trimethyltransferase SUV39H
MSPTAKKKKRQSLRKRQVKQETFRNGNTNRKEARRMPTAEERERVKAKYLDSSDDESELSVDAWEEGEYEVDKIVDESVDMCGYHKYAVLQT